MKFRLGLVVVAGMIAGGSAMAADEPLTFSGFVDVQYQWNDIKTPGLVLQGSSSKTPGIVIQDGAVYATKRLGEGEVRLDVPFQSGASSSNNYNNDFSIATKKTVAYVGYAYQNGVSWKLGQFDTIYGYELNDSPDIFFASQGLVYRDAMPLTHAGLLAGYKPNEALAFNLLAAATNNQGSLGDEKPDFGAQMTFAQGNLRGAVGGLYHKASGGTAYMLDILAGATMGALATDLEFAVRQFGTGGVAGKAGLAHLVYALNDRLSAGVRAEFGKDFALDTTEYQVTVGPAFAMTKELKLKPNYTYHTSSVAGASATADHAVALAALYKF